MYLFYYYHYHFCSALTSPIMSCISLKQTVPQGPMSEHNTRVNWFSPLQLQDLCLLISDPWIQSTLITGYCLQFHHLPAKNIEVWMSHSKWLYCRGTDANREIHAGTNEAQYFSNSIKTDRICSILDSRDHKATTVLYDTHKK